MTEGRKPEYPEKTPSTSFRKCHILKPENSSPDSDSNPYSSIGDRLGKQACYPLYHGLPRSNIYPLPLP